MAVHVFALGGRRNAGQGAGFFAHIGFTHYSFAGIGELANGDGNVADGNRLAGSKFSSEVGLSALIRIKAGSGITAPCRQSTGDNNAAI